MTCTKCGIPCNAISIIKDGTASASSHKAVSSCCKADIKQLTASGTIYLSGPITGTSNFEERFAKAYAEMKRKFPKAEIINPVTLCSHLDPETASWFDYMDCCIKAMASCTHIFMLEGWKDSRGALVEYYIAKEKRLHFV